MRDGALVGSTSLAGSVADIPGISSTGVQKPKVALSSSGGFPIIPPEPVPLKPFALSLDWLAINADTDSNAPHVWDAHGVTTWPDAPYTYIPTTIRTAQFGRVGYMANSQGDKVATLYTDPHQEGQGKGWMQVQFANETLYTGEFCELDNLLTKEGCNYRGLSRLDLAADGVQGEGGNWIKVMQMEMDGKARYYGKADSLTRRYRGKVRGGEFGLRTSNKFIRAYNKTEEMRHVGVKPWICDAWQNTLGMDPYTEGWNVERFEVQLKGREIRRYIPRERDPGFIQGLDDPHLRLDMYASMVPGMFDYRTPGADRARDAEPVVRWDWSLLSDAAPNYTDRRKRNLAMNEHGLKSGIAAMARMGLQFGDPDAVEKGRRYAHAASPYLGRWFDTRLPLWERRVNEILAANCEIDARMRKNLETNAKQQEAIPAWGTI